MSCRVEKRRGFQPPWYEVLVFRCECGELTLRKSWKGPTPPGGVFCPTRRHLLSFNGSITLYPKGDLP